jgi:hypothetical protein
VARGSVVGGQGAAKCCEQRILQIAVGCIVVEHEVRIGRLRKGCQGSRSHPGHRLRGNQHIDGSDKNTRERGFIEQAQSTIEAPSRDAAAEDSLPAGSQIGIFIPRSDDAERARGTSLRCSLDIWRGSPVMIYTPKVATGFSPGFQP